MMHQLNSFRVSQVRVEEGTSRVEIGDLQHFTVLHVELVLAAFCCKLRHVLRVVVNRN